MTRGTWVRDGVGTVDITKPYSGFIQPALKLKNIHELHPSHSAPVPSRPHPRKSAESPLLTMTPSWTPPSAIINNPLCEFIELCRWGFVIIQFRFWSTRYCMDKQPRMRLWHMQLRSHINHKNGLPTSALQTGTWTHTVIRVYFSSQVSNLWTCKSGVAHCLLCVLSGGANLSSFIRQHPIWWYYVITWDPNHLSSLKLRLNMCCGSRQVFTHIDNHWHQCIMESNE